MIKINLYFDSKLHPEVFIKIKNQIIITIKISHFDQLDAQIEKLKKITFQPSKIQVSFFLNRISSQSEERSIKKKIKDALRSPERINYFAVAKMIAPLIYPTKNYTALIQDLSPIYLNEKEALEIIKIMAI